MNNGAQLKWLNNKENLSSLIKSLEEEQVPGEVNWVALQISRAKFPSSFLSAVVIRLLPRDCKVADAVQRGHPQTLRPEDEQEVILILWSILRWRKMSPAELAGISHVTDWSCDWHPCWPLAGKRSRRLGWENVHFSAAELGFWGEERVDKWVVGKSTVCQVLPALVVSRTPHSGQAFQMIASLLRASVFHWVKPPVDWTRSYRRNLRTGSAHGVWSQAVQVLLSVYAHKGWVHDRWHFFQDYQGLPSCLDDLSDHKLSRRRLLMGQHLGAGVVLIQGAREPDFQGQGLWLTPLWCSSFTPWPSSVSLMWLILKTS